MGLFIQIVILIVVLACMVMVLLAIRQLTNFEGFDDNEETIRLKEEIEDDGHIISKNNILNTLVEAEPEKEFKHKDYNSNSKEPVSRRK